MKNDKVLSPLKIKYEMEHQFFIEVRAGMSFSKKYEKRSKGHFAKPQRSLFQFNHIIIILFFFLYI